MEQAKPAPIKLNLMELKDYLIQGKWSPFDRVRPMQKVLLIREARDNHQRAYVGVVKCLRKPNAYVIDMQADVFFEDGVLSKKFKPKELSFRNSSEIRVFILESVSFDAKAKLAEERKAYAKARRALQQAREVEADCFAILGVSKDITEQEFKAVKRKIWKVWHPDKAGYSSLPKDDFLRESKKFTDALAWVQQYLTNKASRTK